MELEERTRDQNHVNTHPVVLLKVTGARVELEERTRSIFTCDLKLCSCSRHFVKLNMLQTYRECVHASGV